MHSFEKNILETCLHNRIFADGDKVIVAVSGGADSVALLHVLAALSGELEISLVVAHVNHGLRPTEAKNEERLVQGYAVGLGLVFHSTCLDVEGESREKGFSLEEAARKLRYAYLDYVMDIEHAAKICVAHHADDQAEEAPPIHHPAPLLFNGLVEPSVIGDLGQAPDAAALGSRA